MQFTKFLVAAAAVAVASAQTVIFTNNDFSSIKVGNPFNITWSGASSDITIKLKTGSATAQVFVSNIITSYTGSSYLWTPPSTTVNGQLYNLEIDHGSDLPNYSVQFYISGGTASASTATSQTSSVTPASSVISSTDSNSSTATSASSGSSSTTKTSATTTASKTAATTSPASSTPTTNSAAQYASPLGFVLMSFVAIAAFN